MSAASASSALPASGGPRTAERSGSATFLNVMHSEFTKLRSVRSTLWTAIAMFVVTVGLSALISWGVSSTIDDMGRESFDATALSLAGITFGQLAIAVLGVMVIATEYSTGGIRTTLTAVPQRLKVLGAKAVVFFLVALVLGTLTSLVSFSIGQLFMAREGLEADLGDPGVLRAVLGGGLYLAGSGMFGFALGTALRNTAGGITVAVAGLVVLPIFTNLLPGDWGDAVSRHFTSNAGQQITTVTTPEGVLSPWYGYFVFTLWWAVILVLGAVLMRRRDA